MKTVTITTGQYAGQEISGTFEFVSKWFPTRLKDEDAVNGDGKIMVMIEGKKRGIWVRKDGYVIEGDTGTAVENNESEEEMILRIRQRFSVMDLMANGIIGGNIRSLIISGAAGIGKTYTLNKRLAQAVDEGAIEYTLINGKLSAIGLYVKLWEARESNSVLMIDDVDVFSDMDTMNILKAALDTGETRTVCWSTASSYLAELDIPNAFEFEGTVVFITNVDIDRELERDSKLTPHLNALISRSVYLDLGVHTNREIMTRVSDIVLTTSMLQDKGLADSEVVEVLEWMKENQDGLRNVSLRTALYLGDFVLTDKNQWKIIAETTMLKA